MSWWQSLHLHVLLLKLNAAQVPCQQAVMWPDWNSTIVLSSSLFYSVSHRLQDARTHPRMRTHGFLLFILSRLNRNLDWKVSLLRGLCWETWSGCVLLLEWLMKWGFTSIMQFKTFMNPVSSNLHLYQSVFGSVVAIWSVFSTKAAHPFF